jgi:hypothetical protein
MKAKSTPQSPPLAEVSSSEIVMPVGKLHATGVEDRGDRLSEHAVWVWVKVRDEQGNKWRFRASAFSTDMEKA